MFNYVHLGRNNKQKKYCVASPGGTNVSTNRRKRKRVQESSRVPASPDLGISANQIPVMVSFQWRHSTQKLWQLVKHGSCWRTAFATGGQHCCITKETQTCSQLDCLLLVKRRVTWLMLPCYECFYPFGYDQECIYIYIFNFYHLLWVLYQFQLSALDLTWTVGEKKNQLSIYC